MPNIQFQFLDYLGLPKPANVKAVFEGEDGLLEGLSEGKIWVDHSTTDYEQMMQFNELVKGKKASVMEAPITGGLEALKKGQMTVFMAGEKDLAEQVSLTETSIIPKLRNI